MYLFDDLVKQGVSGGVSVSGRHGGEEVWSLPRHHTHLIIITGARVDLIRHDLLPEREGEV